MIFKNIFQIYTLLVCLISTIILIISIALFLNALTDLLIPQYKHYSYLVRFESNESYLRSSESHYGVNKERLTELKHLSASQMDEKRINEKKEYLEEQKGKAIESLISTLQWAFVALVFFFLHWRLYKRSEESK